MTFVLTALGASAAVAVELLEALAIVLAVATVRGWRDALLGAGAATVTCLAIAGVVGPVLLGGVPAAGLRAVIGAALLLFGLEWLRKAILRLAGVRARSSSVREYVEQREALEADGLPEPGSADWAARLVAFKGVLLEGVEVVLIVSALGARPGGLAPALTGAGVAVAAVLIAGAALRRPLERLPETAVKCVVGIVLSSFGVFFLGEGLRVDWPGGEVALLYVGAALGAFTALQVQALARMGRRTA